MKTDSASVPPFLNFTIKISEKSGKVIGIKAVSPNQEVLLISNEGLIIRTNVYSIPIFGRVTQGVILMRIRDDDKIAALATVNLKNDQ